MAYKIIYLYDTSVNPDNVPNKLIEDIPSMDPVYGISACLEVKKTTSFSPVGFIMVEYDEDNGFQVLNETYYYINGFIINKNNQPKEWVSEKIFTKDVKELVYINENFCVPFHAERSKILKIPNY